MAELLPCPFCGSTDGPSVFANHRVVCGGCDAEGPSLHNALEANLTAWNTRAAPPPAGAQQAVAKCPDCEGSGVDGDVDDYGRAIDIACGACDGTGRVFNGWQAAIERVARVFQKSVIGMVPTDYATGYTEALEHVRRALAAPAAAQASVPAKWCSHCRKDNHSDSECWSTRIGVHDAWPSPMQMPTAFAWSKEIASLSATPAPEAAPTYTTQPGESLMGIAFRELGSEHRWKEIRNMNAKQFGMLAPHEYYPVGSVLRMPADYHKGLTPAGGDR